MSEICWFTDPTCKNYRPEKIAGKTDWKWKLTSLNMPLVNNLQLEHCIDILDI